MVVLLFLIFIGFLNVAYGFPQQNHILQEINKGTKLLQTSDDVPQNLIWAIENIRKLTDPTDKSDTICKSCEQVINNIIGLRKSEASRDTMMDYLNKLCKVYTDWGLVACKGYVDIEIDTILYIIDHQKNLTSARFCAIYFQQYKCLDSQAEPWSIPLPPPALNDTKLVQKDSDPIRILHVTDVHYDPMYTPGSNAKCDEPLCCENGSPTKPENAAGYWGDYNVCDMPWHSIENLMSHIKDKHKTIDFVYFTGDIISHKSWATSIQNNMESIRLMFQLMAKTFPNTTIYPILGNHESHPTDFFSPGKLSSTNVTTKWIFDLATEEWSRWLPNSTQNTINQGGFYSVLVKPGFRIVALNSNVCFTSNLWLSYDDKDPYDQLLWLVQVLQKAEEDGEKVHILSHIPPGDIQCHTQWSSEFKKIVLRFSKTIVAQFNGHTHIDEFRLFFDSVSGEPLNVAYNGGSFTTFVGYNPNYRIYHVDNNTMTVTNYDQYIYNMTKANSQSAPQWFKLYSFKEAYGLSDMQLTSLGQLYKRMSLNNSDNDLVDKYYRFMVRESDNYMAQGCDSKCKKSLVCYIKAVESRLSVNC